MRKERTVGYVRRAQYDQEPFSFTGIIILYEKLYTFLEQSYPKEAIENLLLCQTNMQ